MQYNMKKYKPVLRKDSLNVWTLWPEPSPAVGKVANQGEELIQVDIAAV
jgi:hypothetical protein